MGILHIQLLGDFLVTVDAQPLTTVNRPRLQSLLAYLVLHSPAPQLRGHLAFLFWPDTDEAQALTNFRNLLHKLRRELPDAVQYLAIDAQTVQWRPDAPYTLDVAQFEAAAQPDATRAQLTQAAKLYRGDLLPSCYDGWIEPIRGRLHLLAESVLARLVQADEDARDLDAALLHAQQSLDLDPLNEETQRTLMRLYALRGDRAGAQRIFHASVARLREELDVEPSPETRELAARLLDGAPLEPSEPQRHVAHAHLPLIGRGIEWRHLRDAWRRAAAGAPTVALLTGEAGIGKTRLAEELVQWVARQGYATAEARCYAAAGALTYAPVSAWLRTAALRAGLAQLDPLRCSEVARVLPELLTETPSLPTPLPITQGWQLQRFYEALARAVLIGGRPQLLFLDDLQWADPGTLEWLHFLLRFDPSARLLLLCTLRNDEPDAAPTLPALLAALEHERSLFAIALSPLDAIETASLAAQVAGQPLSPNDASCLFHETEGNPLFVVETIRAMEETGARVESVGESTLAPVLVEATPRTLPPRIQQVIRHRLDGLSPAARELAGLAAVIGREFAFPVLARASQLPHHEVVASLDELWQRRIVRERGVDVHDFSHDKLREVAVGSLSAARRRLYHQWVAQALEEVYPARRDAICGQLAAHYERAGDLPQAIPYFRRAGELAQAIHANATAIAAFRRALALADACGSGCTPASVALRERLGDVLFLIGEYTGARAEYLETLARLDVDASPADARLMRKIGNTWRAFHQYTEALAAYDDACRRLEQRLPDLAAATPEQMAVLTDDVPALAVWQEWIQVMLEIKLVQYWLGELDASAELDRRLEPVVERFGAPGQRADFYRLKSSLAFRRNRSVATDASVATLRRGLAILEEAGDMERIPAMRFMIGFDLLWSDHAEEALTALADALHLAEQIGDVSLQARCLTYRTIALRRCERVDEAAASAEKARDVAEQAHMPEYVAQAEANLGWVAWRRGRPRPMLAHMQTALEVWRTLPPGHASAPFQWTARWPLLAWAVEEAALDRALEHAQALLDPLQQQLPTDMEAALQAAVAAGHADDPAQLLDRLRRTLQLAQARHYL